jgi:hypothetical protein
MEAATRTAQKMHSTDRVLEALATLAAFLDRTINEVKSLDVDFQNRLLQAVHDTETSIQSQAAQHLDNALGDLRRRVQEEYEKKIADLTSDWSAERQRLQHELERATQAGLQWEEQRAHLNSELENTRKEAAQAIAEAELQKAEAKAESEKARTALSAPPEPPFHSEHLLGEVERVEGAIKRISAIIDDPATELSSVIRKNVERAELEAYLKGIRFAITGPNGK